jgi:hypothetical protein
MVVLSLFLNMNLWLKVDVIFLLPYTDGIIDFIEHLEGNVMLRMLPFLCWVREFYGFRVCVVL